MASMLTDADYNRFSVSLVTRLANRLRGLDSTAARLVGERPQDHILAGFLTPSKMDEARSSPDDDEVVEEMLASDLPRDSAYEQTSIGAEWLMPAESTLGNVNLLVGGSLYVRRLPQFDEQSKLG